MPVGHDDHEPRRQRRITGTLRLPPGRQPATPKRLVFRVLDVGRADADATVVAERVHEDEVLGPETPFELRISSSDLDRVVTGELIVQVHADMDGTGQLAPGDLLTTRSYPVAASLDEEPPLDIELTAI
jgi:hypothetical protein